MSARVPFTRCGLASRSGGVRAFPVQQSRYTILGLALQMRRHTRGISGSTSAVHPQGTDERPPNSASTAPAPTDPFLLNSKHADFKKSESARSPFDHAAPIKLSRSPNPEWKYGDGASTMLASEHPHVEIDPCDPERSMISNYRLLISGIPRPISFVSTISIDGNRNLAPFSYFQVVDHDPPIFVIGFSARRDRLKDTRRNLVETGECVINVVSEHMIEAVNATSLDVPYGVSEWELSGLAAGASSTVKPERVKDAVFSIEGKLLEMKELDYDGKHAAEGKPSGALAIIQATRFWVREDALNNNKDDIELGSMRPLVQLGGIAYGRVRDTFELPRPGLQTELNDDSRGLRKFLEEKI